MNRTDLLTKVRDLMTEIEKLRRIPNFTHGQKAKNENGRLPNGITAPGNDPDSPQTRLPDETIA